MSGPIALISHAHGIPLVILARSVRAKVGYQYISTKPVPKVLVGSFRGLRRRAGTARVLDAEPLLLRRSAVAPLLAELDARDARLVPVSLHEDGVVYDDDWVWVHPLRTFPIDRARSKLGAGRTLAWRDPPTAPIFRLVEYPHLVCAQRAFYERLHAATKRKVVEATPPYTEPNPTYFPLRF